MLLVQGKISKYGFLCVPIGFLEEPINIRQLLSLMLSPQTTNQCPWPPISNIYATLTGESVSLEHSEEHQGNGGRETEDSVLEYDSPSSWEESEEETFVSNNNESDDVSGEIPLLDGEANFLLRTVSQFMSIRFSNRILF